MARIAIIHPDLGLGGAERLIIDLARALQDLGCRVTIYTGHHNKQRCFEETINGTLQVVSIGQWIPRSIFGLFHALISYLKMIYIALYVLLTRDKYTHIVCDQVSACIPVLRMFNRNRSKIIFYCHFPDQLLTQRKSLTKKIYRKPLDYFEEWSTGLADIILVNSRFTGSVVRRTFKSLAKHDLSILYPCVDVRQFADHVPKPELCSEVIKNCWNRSKECFMFLSLNRFERKKNITLAVEGLAECLSSLEGLELTTSLDVKKLHLIVAGGYDERIMDCVAYYKELEALVTRLKITNHVTFIKSPNDEEKLLLLASCQVVVYTPENEHFGIVPIEAMAMKKAVIASASGGPLETVESEVSGILCPPDKSSFGDAMYQLASDPSKSRRMGEKGFNRVRKLYSYESFRQQLGDICSIVTSDDGDERKSNASSKELLGND